MTPPPPPRPCAADPWPHCVWSAKQRSKTADQPLFAAKGAPAFIMSQLMCPPFSQQVGVITIRITPPAPPFAPPERERGGATRHPTARGRSTKSPLMARGRSTKSFLCLAARRRDVIGGSIGGIRGCSARTHQQTRPGAFSLSAFRTSCLGFPEFPEPRSLVLWGSGQKHQASGLGKFEITETQNARSET